MKTRISGKEAARVAEDMAIRCGSAKPVANYYEAVRPSLAHQLVEANLGPFRTAVELIGSIPDIKNLGAHVIVSEIGIDSLLVAAPITVEGLDQLILKPKQLDGITAVYERGEHPGIHGCPAGYCEERRCRQGGFNALSDPEHIYRVQAGRPTLLQWCPASCVSVRRRMPCVHRFALCNENEEAPLVVIAGRETFVISLLTRIG
jgi:hypothetical protein